MCGKLIYLISIVSVLSLVLTTAAEAADPDLVAHWRFDETSGTTAFDASGNGHDGTIMGDPQWVPGKLGGALEFDGAGDYVDCGASPDYEIAVNITIACWIKVDVFDKNWQAIITTSDSSWRVHRSSSTNNIAWGSSGLSPTDLTGTTDVSTGEWFHVAAVYNGAQKLLYINGNLDASSDSTGNISVSSMPVYIGENSGATGRFWDGLIDDVRIYKRALAETELLGVMSGGGVEYPLASGPTPPDGEYLEATWVSMSWRAGDFAVSHDLYLSENLDDVSNSTADAFRGSQTDTMYIVGFPGFAYPDGLVPGTTYYWRVDEVNDTEPNSPWIGDLWSFTVPPKTAYNPDPADGAEFVDPNATFSWTGGFAAKLHTVYMGTNFDDVNNAAGGAPMGFASYSPGPLESEKVYYWRVDEFDPPFTHKGDVWSFTTPGAVGNPQPANGAADVQMIATLSWTAADNAASHELYFGADAEAVRNATTASPEYIGPRALGAESYDPGGLAWDSSYAWRVDEVYPAETVKGLVWSFSTADFILVDDFESYNDIDPPDEASNRIFDKWIDGFGTTDNGALVGNDLPPYAEQTVVHGGIQSMPYFYDNANKTSEATLTLVWPRDWTEEGVAKLSLWFRGDSGNAADRIFVALNGVAVIYHDDSAATQLSGWNEWVIDLAAFGVDLT
ncbi:MAG: LamG domain-containing protein, partial [Planctomycetota bacterium]